MLDLQGRRKVTRQVPNQNATGKKHKWHCALKTHEKFLEAQGLAEEEATKCKIKGNNEVKGGRKKLKTAELRRFFPTNAP